MVFVIGEQRLYGQLVKQTCLRQLSSGTSGAHFPPPNVLSQEHEIQEEVRIRFRELAKSAKIGNTKIKCTDWSE